MRVLHIANHFHPCIGGVETFAADLCLNLKKNGVDCRVLSFDKCPNSKEKLLKSGEFGGIKISRVSFIDLKYYKLGFFSLDFLKNFDCVHVHGLGFFSDFKSTSVTNSFLCSRLYR